MAMIYKNATILKRLINPYWQKLSRYGTLANKMTSNYDNSIVWIDMEMTGLELDTCHILEVACLVTDPQLKIISNEFSVVINQPDSILESMNNWCKKQHQLSGLIDACKNSKIPLERAEADLLEFLKSYVPAHKCPLAGNSVYMDRMFLTKYMPSINNYLHYRIIDTSSIKECTRRWNFRAYENAPRKNLNHRAIDDIKESIKELQYYKANVFINSD